MSEAEFLELPEEKPYLEYVDGVVLQKPMPNADHGLLTGQFAIELGLYARTTGGKMTVEQQSRIGLTPSYRLPDVSYFSPETPFGNDAIPSVAVEVRSPTQTMGELREKCRSFRRNGVAIAWLVEPASRTVEVFERSIDGELHRAPEILTSARLPGFKLDLTALFANLDR